MYSSYSPPIQVEQAPQTFLGVKLDVWILGALGFSIGCVSGPITGFIWLAAALGLRQAAHFVYNYVVRIHLIVLPQGVDARVVEALILASAPVLIALSNSEGAVGLALATVFALAANTILRATSLSSAFIQMAPLAGACLLILAHSLWAGAIQPLIMTAWLSLALGLVASARQRIEHTALNAAMLGQALKEALPSSSAIWEMDFRNRTLKGADQLAHLLGRPISFDDLAADRLGAPTQERELVADVFAPHDGKTRFVYLVHEARAGNGRVLRLQHRGVLHADASGAPISLACMTMITATEKNGLSLADQWQGLRARYPAAPQIQRDAAVKLTPQSKKRRAQG